MYNKMKKHVLFENNKTCRFTASHGQLQRTVVTFVPRVNALFLCLMLLRYKNTRGLNYNAMVLNKNCNGSELHEGTRGEQIPMVMAHGKGQKVCFRCTAI